MSSAASPRFRWSPGSAVCAALVVLVAAAAAWFWREGFLLYYGDAQAHLNISRSIIDSRTPGYDQLGTVWLPVLHVLCLPFVRFERLWSSGLAGTIPCAACFVVAGTCFYGSALRAYANPMAASIVSACFALNPNVLYLASIPLTEMVFLAGLAVLLFALLHFRDTQQRSSVLIGLAACWWISLTRYDGWFLIPFAALGFAYFAQVHRLLLLVLFGVLASLAPLYWMAHNYWESGDALFFYRGPYSALAIQGGKPYPGYHDWLLAAFYYLTAGRLCAGWPLLFLGAAGTVCAVLKRALMPIAFLALTPAFYVWSLHSSGTPIHVPVLWPFSYYNTRYGIAVVAWAAFAAGAITLALPVKHQRWALLIPIVSALPWMVHPTRQDWVCWKESEVNSVSRRAWTAAAANFLREHAHPGDGILVTFGDLTGVLAASGIPIHESLHEGNGPEWLATVTRPDLVHSEKWAVAQAGDAVSNTMAKPGAPYHLIGTITVKDAKVLELYQEGR